MMAWAQALHASGDDDRARYVVQRLKEFRSSQGDDWRAECGAALEQAEAHLKTRGIVQAGDVYAITCGEPMGAPGGTNMLKICRAT